MPELNLYPVGQPEKLDADGKIEQENRREAIRKQRLYYDGKQFKPLKVRSGQPDDNVIINLVRRVIDQSVSMLMGDAPKISATNPNVQPLLDAFLERNNFDWLLSDMATSGGKDGHVFFKLNIPGGNINNLKPTMLNGENVSAFWKPDDMDQVICYKIEWGAGERLYRQDIYIIDGVWYIQDYRKESQSGNWIPGNLDQWPYDFCPVVDWQNLPDYLCYYGKPDVPDLTLNDALNFSASNVNRILKYHAHPKTIVTGVDANQIKETAVDGLWAIGNVDAKANNLEMQSDLESSMNFISFLQQSFYSQYRAVDTSVLKDKLGQLTNFGILMLYKDAIDKNATKQRLYGNGIRVLLQRCGEVLGVDFDVTIQWGDPVGMNDAEEIAGIQTEMGLKILSKQSATELRGRDWETEQKRIAKEGESEKSGLANILMQTLKAMETGADNNEDEVENGEENANADN